MAVWKKMKEQSWYCTETIADNAGGNGYDAKRELL